MIHMLREAWSRLRATFAAERIDQDLDDELAAHRDMLIDELRRAGLSEQDARREAARKLGRLDTIREDHRAARGLPALDLVAQSLRLAARRLARTPFFTTVVTLTLALGVGANTALFSLVDNLLLRSLPVRNPERLVELAVYELEGSRPKDKATAGEFDPATFAAVRAETRVVEAVVGYMRLERPKISLDGVAQPERNVDMVSPRFFSDLGVPLGIGRSPDETDDNVVVISDRWWRTRFAGSPDALGRVVTIDGRSYTMIGVAPRHFHGFEIDRSVDAWIAPATAPMIMIARLQPGVTGAQAEAVLHPVLFATADKRWLGSGPHVTVARDIGRGISELRTAYSAALVALMALVTLVLLATCANVGNLVMLRNTARRRELAVRSALGASRSRLVAHSLVETTLLAAAGCVGGVLLAGWGVSIVVALLPLPASPDALTFRADGRTLLYASGICALSALLFALGPAWRAADVNLAGTLQSSGLTAPKRMRYFGRALVGLQVALSVLLLAGGGLFVQTLRNLSRLQMGYSTERLLEITIDPRFAGYQEDQVPGLARLLLERVRDVPGVRSATRTSWPLMRSNGSKIGVPLPNLPENTGMWDMIDVGPGFFETMGIDVVRGRAFTEADFAADTVELRRRVPLRTPAEFQQFVRRISPFVINESFAKKLFAGTDPMPPGSPVVGIVKDAKLFGVKADVQPLMFVLSRRPGRVAAIQVRSAGDPQAVQKGLRDAIQSVNPQLLLGISSLGDVAGRSIAKERMVASISGFFSVLGLVLAGMGVFGIASSAVAQRTKELGIRRALGAQQWTLIRDSIGDTLIVICVGMAVGTLATVGVVRVTSSVTADLLYGLTAGDAVNLMTSVAVMLVMGLAACATPAVRATRVDPLRCIRED